MTERKTDKKKKRSKAKAFPVPFDLEEIKENLTVNSNTHSKLSKEQLIKEAFKLHSEGKIKKAANYYQYLIDKGCTKPRVFSNYGVILQSLGKIKEAEIIYLKAIKLKPDLVEAHYNLGTIFIGLENLKKDAYINLNFLKLYRKFSPGPLTYILKKKKKSKISSLANGSLKTIAVRFPKHCIAKNLLRKIGNTSDASQRELSSSLGVSLGKINYCLKGL